MGLYRKKNIVIGAVGRLLLPESLWTRQMLLAWGGCLLSIAVFDVLWCLQTSFVPFRYFGTYVNALLFATLLSFPTVVWRRSWPQLAVMLLADVFMMANLMYCNNCFNAIPAASYLSVLKLTETPGVLSAAFRWIYLLLPGIALVTFMMMNPRQTDRKPNRVFYLLTLGLLLIISAVTALFHGGMVSHVDGMRGERDTAQAAEVIYTPAGYLLADMMSEHPAVTPAQRRFVAGWGSDQMRYQGQMSHPSDSVPRRENLVMIVCESLESWPVGTVVEGKELTPSLNRTLADSTLSVWYAPRVLSQAGRGRGIDGQLLMLAGMYPMHDFVFSMQYAGNNYFTLPKAMKMAGAKTYILGGAKPIDLNQEPVARSFGIDNIELSDTWDNSERIGEPGVLSDKSLFSQSEAKMRRGDVWPEGEKAYVQIVTSTMAPPFDVPAEHRTIALGGNYPQKLRDYMTAVHYTDNAIGSFLDYLRSRDDWNRTMVVIAGNHEAFGSRRHSLRQDPLAAKMVNAQEFVPLIIINAPFSGRRGAVMGQADVYTTLLDQMGLPYIWRGMGFSALSPDSPAFAVGYDGDIVGDIRNTPSDLMKHVENARKASDILIRFDLMGD